jgi:hypothetical protein
MAQAVVARRVVRRRESHIHLYPVHCPTIRAANEGDGLNKLRSKVKLM